MTKLQALQEAELALRSYAQGGNDKAAEAEPIISLMIDQEIARSSRKRVTRKKKLNKMSP